MTPARFQTIEQIYREALDQDPDQVGAFLDRACEGDAVLRRKVEALLSSRQRANGFIEQSAVGLAARIIQNGDAESLVGKTIGHYKISESIGTGGMGEVYLATDIVARRKAALKLLPLRFTDDAERLKRFEREARAVVALNHPNILTVYEIGEDNSIHYIASELIEGETLRDRLARGRMPLTEALDVAIQVASALAAAHHAGIIHRDIKPENIMLRPDGYAKVLDFGIAKLAEQELSTSLPKHEALLLVDTNLGSVLGTVRYMSPEQARGGHVDKTTDIWSLGVVLYEMVTGHGPFSGDTPKEVISSILGKEPPALSRSVARAPAGLQQIVSKALGKDPARRYHSAPDLLHALKELRRKLEFKLQRATAPFWLRWVRSPVALVVMLLAATLALTFTFVRRPNLAMNPPPEKSIAVLPFENLSKDEENAFFAGGVQDEILTDLSKVADLKVISRTSVMKYKSGSERNLRDIARTLGVSHVVEGSVQRAGARVRVNVQLIDARKDAHLWAEHYDRDFSDIFSIQSEIAQRIADQLRAELSPSEKAAIQERPTADLVAYAYYIKAKEMNIYENWHGAEKPAAQRVELLEKATERDPNFALAYCELAKAEIEVGDLGQELDTARHLKLAKKAADTALRLRPDLPEPHLALARCYWYTASQVSSAEAVSYYGRAGDEVMIVRQKLPNNPEALFLGAMVGRHQNRWDASLADLKRASELDPRNREIAYHLWATCFEMRRYSDCEKLALRASDGKAENPSFKTDIAEIKLAQGDPIAAQRLLKQVPVDFNPTPYIWGTRFTAALYLRDYDEADRMVAMRGPKGAASQFGAFGGPPEWAQAQVARARGDKQNALDAFAAARRADEARDRDKPYDQADYLAALARYDAGLGRKENAIREALRAVELQPMATESLNGPVNIANLALVYAWTGERDAALAQLEKIVRLPGYTPTYGDLLLNPCWDDLRGDPRFEKIIAAAKAASK
jgi:serine/threonine protein kinase/tetratricopeptide (TPR) repeat protein